MPTRPGAPAAVVDLRDRAPAGRDGDAAERPDPGLFGPDSVSWRVHGDPLMGVGGLRALLLQSLHPVVAEGFDAHSRYRQEPWPRLLRTADFVALTTFGSVEQVHRAAAHVRRAHDRPARARDDGTPRRLDDPELLLWVHCCLVDSMLHVVRRGGLDLDDREADAYVAEQVRAAALLGVPPSLVPTCTADLTDYLAGVRDGLRLSDAAREAVAVVLAPPLHPVVELATPARAGWASIAGLAFATLPDWARRLFPLPLRTGAAVVPEAAVSSSLRALRLTGRGVGALVPALRRSPHERAARRRLGLDAPVPQEA
ncbi:oxygenase MpaB family protein [Aquipuribacter sp. SD81]|uniref:oxygenase MpaB family protein n=1 Tax=Aquipuribacter sp. SD81 TaxID=3127703 RepID=UPI003017359D